MKPSTTRLRMLVPMLFAVFWGCVLTTLPASASPLYLLNQRAGGQFTYEARRNIFQDYEAMLDDSTYNYPYAFTAEMNNMLKELLTYNTLRALTGDLPNTFDTCVGSFSGGLFYAIYKSGGCIKSLLHAGVAGDCVATNPLCCILYWRYPASLSDRLPLRDIDPRLIFWDGTQAVNGFFTNFSSDYLTNYSDCNALPIWPPDSRATVEDGTALSVDANGEWRFTRRKQPALSFVEHHIARPTAAQKAKFASLSAAGVPAWEKVHHFGDIPIIAPIVACAGLLLVCLVTLLLFYFFTEPKAQKEQEELRTLIQNLETSAAEQEAEICRRRTRSERCSPQSTNGSFAKAPKPSPSPMDFNRSITPFSTQPSQLHLTDPRSVAAGAAVAAPMGTSPSRVQSNLSTSVAALSRYSSQSQLCLQPQQSGTSASRRAFITPDHRRPARKQDSPQQLQQRASSSNLIRSNSFVGGAPSQQLPRTGSMHGRTNSVPLPATCSARSFQNPLVGRQSFKK